MAIDLAAEPDFTLGRAKVSPSSLQMIQAGTCRALEPRIMQVLVALAKRRGEVVSREALMAAGWGSRVVGEDALYRAVMEVRKLGQESGAFSLENVRRVGYRLTEARSADEAGAAPARSPTPRAVPWALPSLAALVLAAGAALAWSWATSAHPRWQNGRVEVAPARAALADPGLQRLSDPFEQAMVRSLATSGVETTLGPSHSPAEFRILSAFGQEGALYSAYAQIVDRRSGLVLWSKRFERNASDAAGFPEAVANRVGDTLFCAMGSRSRSRKRMSPAIFGMFLNACADRRPPNGGADRFFEVTRQLTEAAPDLSVAHSMHAVAASVLASNADAKLAPEYFQATRSAADRALRLDPGNGEAYFAIGIAYGPGRSWLDRERNFAKAAQLTPDLSVVHNYEMEVLYEVGRFQEAVALNAKVAGRDVFSPFALRRLAEARAASGDGPAAEAVLRRIDQMDAAVGRLARFDILLWSTDPAAVDLDALAADGRGVVSDARLDCALAYVRRRSSAAHQRLSGLPGPCEAAPLEWRIQMLARAGDIDGAYVLAGRERAAIRDPGPLFTPQMRAFRADPRFMPLARALGLVDYWRGSGHWPDFCSEPSRPYDCEASAAGPPASTS
jgi:DNA-binding winged helix-turn-helix (wHTH) protein/tetratricopeptide (TPR) repeat protein